MSILEAIYPRGKLSVLDALVKQRGPVPLRQLAKLSCLSLRATQVNVDALEKMGLLSASRVGNTLQISLDESHLLLGEIREILEVLERSSLVERGRKLTDKATKLLTFIDEGAALVARAKSSQ